MSPCLRGSGSLVWRALAVLALALFLACAPEPSSYESEPIDTTAEPEQGEAEETEPWRFEKGGYEWTFTPLASYILRGIVVGRENYSSEWNSILSPCDIAAAWGPLLEGDLYLELDWSQSGRWYYWEYGAGFPKDNTFIARHSSNTHILPASDILKRAAKSVSEGDAVELSGTLVRVDGKKGGDTRWWVSSRTRTDTGNGSCEVLYLKRLRVGEKVYE